LLFKFNFDFGFSIFDLELKAFELIFLLLSNFDFGVKALRDLGVSTIYESF